MPRHPHVAQTTETIVSRPFGELVERIQKRKGTLHPLHIGDTWLEPLEAARAENQRAADHRGLHTYPPPRGMDEFIEAVAEHVLERSGVRRERAEIQVMSGATVGLSTVCQAVLMPGDEVLLPSPYWPLIRGMIASRGAAPVEVPLYTRLSDPEFDAEAALEAKVSPRTVAVYVNSPNNPSGHVIGDRVAAALARVAARHDLWVITDETYEDVWFRDEPPSIWARDDIIERAIATHTLSKAYGLAGARVGYTHGPAEVMRTIRGVQTFNIYSASRPMQLGAARALREGGAWLAKTRETYREAARAASGALGLDCPPAGTFLFFDTAEWLPPGADDAFPFLARCVDAGVLLVPGASCGEAFRTWARLCFTSVPPDELSDALERLRGVMEDSCARC